MGMILTGAVLPSSQMLTLFILKRLVSAIARVCNSQLAEHPVDELMLNVLRCHLTY